MRKWKEETARQLLLDPVHKSTDVVAAIQEDPEANNHSAMSPELRGCHTTWNPSSSVCQRAADQDEQDVSEEKCGLTAIE